MSLKCKLCIHIFGNWVYSLTDNHTLWGSMQILAFLVLCSYINKYLRKPQKNWMTLNFLSLQRILLKNFSKNLSNYKFLIFSESWRSALHLKWTKIKWKNYLIVIDLISKNLLVCCRSTLNITVYHLHEKWFRQKEYYYFFHRGGTKNK